MEEGKMRIYEQYQKSLSKSENISFLKKEYGIGGSSSAVPYTGVGEDHDSKGIELHLGSLGITLKSVSVNLSNLTVISTQKKKSIIRGGLNVRKNYGQSEPLSEKSVKHFLRRRQKRLSLRLLSMNTDIRLVLRYISAQASMKSSPLMMTV